MVYRMHAQKFQSTSLYKLWLTVFVINLVLIHPKTLVFVTHCATSDVQVS